ncbi:hypothetical protein BJF78_04355 [Pseudonocardia sp. CNS-139]|nr:hypothetical protein BJF78_04355 [Pseudonocardia sp. CNS-139]
MAVGHTVSPRLLPHLTDSATSGPDVDLLLSEVSDIDVVDRVHHREAHAGLLHLPPAVPGGTRHIRGRAQGLEVAVVAREPLVAVLPEGHPAASDERVDLASLHGPRVVLTDAAGEGFAAHTRAVWKDIATDTGAPTRRVRSCMRSPSSRPARESPCCPRSTWR